MEDLRGRLTALLSFEVGGPRELVFLDERPRDGYVERTIGWRGEDGAVPALLLVPDRPSGGGVVVHHQHHAQWHFGKSEVAGLCGDPLQAFGPPLARRGLTVIAHDAIGFEDRRPEGPGNDARASDPHDYFRTMCYRLVRGRPLMSAVLSDAAAAHSALAALDWVDSGHVGALGHSMGGATVLLHAALDARIAFAAVSGSACTYRARMAEGTGIDAAQTIPGLLKVGDLDEIAALVAPRPFLLCSATDDQYSRDAPKIAEVVARAYRLMGASDALRHDRVSGGHALTTDRFAAIVDWVGGQVASI